MAGELGWFEHSIHNAEVVGSNPTPATKKVAKPHMNNNPIGILDSGVGGLSVLSEINSLLPQEATIYFADQAYMPYGLKTPEELIYRVERIIGFLKEKNVKAIVIACNTATVFTIKKMRQKFNFPIIGVVPVIKTIANATKTGIVAVLSTPTTAKSEYLDNLINEFASDKKVLIVGESHLEDLIEEGKTDSEEIAEILNKELTPLIGKNVDAIALGCTHYPFVKKKIQEIVGKNVLVADSGGAVARRLKQVLEHENLLALQKGTHTYYTTGRVEKFEKVAGKLLRTEIEAESLNL